MTSPGDESHGARNAPTGPKTAWPSELASVGAIRFARTYYHYSEAVRFFGDLVGLPLYEQFEGSYGENGSIFALPSSAFTFELVQGTSRLEAAGIQPSESHPYWAATGGVTYRDPDGRQVVFAPLIYD